MKKEILIHTDELNRKWIDRMSAEGGEVLGLHPVGGNESVDSLEHLLRSFRDPEFRELVDYAAERGLEIEYEMHAAGYLLPRGLFAAHPEYFRMNENGERVSDYNFCISNKDALDIVASRAVQLANSLYRSRHSYYFWMDDKKGRRLPLPAVPPIFCLRAAIDGC